MAETLFYKWAAGVLAAIVVSALVVGLVVFLVQRSQDSNDDTSDTTGARVTNSLKLLVFVSRHGNRGASGDYRNDPYPLDDPEYWPYGVDRLTPKGRVQMYKLGERVRDLYNGFVNSTYNPDELHASSTYKDRMLLSGEAFLAGLYPPKGWQVWNADIPWQPTPLYSDSPDKTIIIDGCSRYVDNYLELGEEFLKTNAENLSAMITIYDNATGATDTGLDGVVDLWVFWDKAASEDQEGYTLPDWAKTLYSEPLRDLVAKNYILTFAGNQEIIRLVVGEMYDEILGVVESVVNGTETELKLQYYSGHDSTIIALQELLGVSSETMVSMVKPGSGLVLELHQNQNTSQYYFEVVYIDGGTTDLNWTSLDLPACGDPCDYTTLLNNTVQYTDVDYEEECNTNSSLISHLQSLPLRYFT